MRKMMFLVVALIGVASVSSPALAQIVLQDFDLRTYQSEATVALPERRERPMRQLTWPSAEQPAFVLDVSPGRASLGLVRVETSRLLRRSWTYTRDLPLGDNHQIVGLSFVFALQRR